MILLIIMAAWLTPARVIIDNSADERWQKYVILPFINDVHAHGCFYRHSLQSRNLRMSLFCQDGETWRCFGGRDLNLTHALAV